MNDYSFMDHGDLIDALIIAVAKVERYEVGPADILDLHEAAERERANVLAYRAELLRRLQ